MKICRFLYCPEQAICPTGYCEHHHSLGWCKCLEHCGRLSKCQVRRLGNFYAIQIRLTDTRPTPVMCEKMEPTRPEWVIRDWLRNGYKRGRRIGRLLEMNQPIQGDLFDE